MKGLHEILDGAGVKTWSSLICRRHSVVLAEVAWIIETFSFFNNFFRRLLIAYAIVLQTGQKILNERGSMKALQLSSEWQRKRPKFDVNRKEFL